MKKVSPPKILFRHKPNYGVAKARVVSPLQGELTSDTWQNNLGAKHLANKSPQAGKIFPSTMFIHDPHTGEWVSKKVDVRHGASVESSGKTARERTAVLKARLKQQTDRQKMIAARKAAKARKIKLNRIPG